MARPLKPPRALIALAVALALPAPAAAQDDPSRQPPFGGQVPPPLVRVFPDGRGAGKVPPPGFELTPFRAIGIALHAEAVQEEVPPTGLDPVAYTRGDRWQIEFFTGSRDDSPAALVVLDDATGEVDEAWNDHQVETELARGYEGAIAQMVNAPYVWLPLCLLFLLPFFDFRRPFRLLHLDLLVLLGLGASLLFFNRAEIVTSVALTYPVLGYVLIRMLVAGLRPRERPGPLVPSVPIRWLAIAAILLAAGRIALNVADSQVIDVGVAGVIGADRVEQGEELYDGDFAPGIDIRGDVYPPFNYLSYIPFEQAFPWDGEWDSVPAAHAAAIAFDLLVVAGLWLLGRRLRAGEEGRRLGVALAFAWLAYPFTLYTMNANANDALVAALLVVALLALASPVRRALAIALGGAAKFGPAAVAPLFATGRGERRWRSAGVFSVVFAAASAVLVIPFLPDGGLSEFYDRTFGYQASRGSPFSVWGLAPSLDPVQPVVRAAAIGLALAVALWPPRKSPAQVAAFAAAVVVGVQLGATHWFYFYVVWFLPLFLVASFAEVSRPSSSAPRAAAS